MIKNLTPIEKLLISKLVITPNNKELADLLSVGKQTLINKLMSIYDKLKIDGKYRKIKLINLLLKDKPILNLYDLNEEQMQIVKLLCENNDLYDISEKMFISEHTVFLKIRQISEKMSIDGQAIKEKIIIKARG
jgi:DNA-binding CsgD family transcriptional regulator